MIATVFTQDEMAFISSVALQRAARKVDAERCVKRARGARFGPRRLDGERNAPETVRRNGHFIKSRVTAQVSIHPGSVGMMKTLQRPARVSVTRERGKNGALMEAIEQMFDFIEVVELPCVETRRLPGAQQLEAILCASTRDAGENLGDNASSRDVHTLSEFEWMVVTSPEAAAGIIHAWRQARCPALPKVAAVGRATAGAFDAVGVTVSFVPSRATGRTLCAEFAEGDGRVLYATSLKAGRDIEEGLRGKGYDVLRLNTYTTESVDFDSTMKTLAGSTDIVTFASPSAVRAWVGNVGVNDDVVVACIGETSADAAREAGFTRVHFPQQPGLDGWVVAVCEAMSVFEANKESGRVGGGRVDVDVVTDKDGKIYKA